MLPERRQVTLNSGWILALNLNLRHLLFSLRILLLIFRRHPCPKLANIIQFKQKNCWHGSVTLRSHPNHEAFVLCQTRVITELWGKPCEISFWITIFSRQQKPGYVTESSHGVPRLFFLNKRGRKIGMKFTFLFGILVSIELASIRGLSVTYSGSLSHLCLL